MKYNVEYVLRGTITYTVEADSFEDAKRLGLVALSNDRLLNELDADGELYYIERHNADGTFDEKYYL